MQSEGQCDPALPIFIRSWRHSERGKRRTLAKGRAIFNKTLLIALNIFAKLIKKAKTKEALQEALFTISIQQSFY